MNVWFILGVILVGVGALIMVMTARTFYAYPSHDRGPGALIVLVGLMFLAIGIGLHWFNHGHTHHWWWLLIIAAIALGLVLMALQGVFTFFVTIVALGALAFFLIIASSGPSHDQAKPAQQRPVITSTTKDCPPAKGEWPLKYDPNTGDNFVSTGLKGKTPQERLKNNQVHRGEDPRKLYADSVAAYGQPPNGAKKWQDLTTNNLKCLNQKGHDALVIINHEEDEQFKAGLVINQAAPKVGANTGVNATTGEPFQMTVAKISGNRDAVKVTYKNGRVVWYMMRCANPVTSGPIPGLPVKPGSHPTPHPTPHPSPTCKAENGMPANSCKDGSQSVLFNSSVPAYVQGCSADTCQGGTATGANHYISSAPPGRGSTGCGSSGSDPCPAASPRPTTAYPSPSAGSPSPIAPGSGGGSKPVPSASGSPSGGPPPG